ncbi:m-AAA protease-interacting protein 1, mitochondrial [Hypomesus transpacificus]|uniref:m-AAA protease-interacting protein 1, mitochondrial n=1 Tax=Hypomesus transpacificus TaxID=137520 RepID=UPI001F083E4B|nr:m-AAA protease-interacting protein 1, mitochondrial [Hypomesus transpacificus]
MCLVTYIVLYEELLSSAHCISSRTIQVEGQKCYGRKKMALPMLRGCYCSRPPSTLFRLFKPERVVLSRSKNTRPIPTVDVGVVSAVRTYSSDRGGLTPKQKVVVVNIPNPFKWIRTRIYYFLIRAYFDKEFRIEEFTDGAKQAFSHVSILLSQCQFEALESLVAPDLIGKLKEKCSLLPPSHIQAISADPEEIMYTMPEDVGICYDDDGRKFVIILMRFWYLTSAELADDTMEGARIFQISAGEGDAKAKRLLTANYEFQREFTKGVAPDWIITRIEHSRLLD